MSFRGALKGVLAGVTMIVATGVTAVSAQQPEGKEAASYDSIMKSVDAIEVGQLQLARLRERIKVLEAETSLAQDRLENSENRLESSENRLVNAQNKLRDAQFRLEHGDDREVKKNVRVNFASHFPSGEAITQSMYEVGASLAKKSAAPQVVILVVRDPDDALTLRSGNRFSNTEYEQKIVDMAKNVSNSFEDPQAKVLLMLAVAQEGKINTRPGDVLFYINDRVDHFSPASENYKGVGEDRFIRDVALSLEHQFSTGHYKLSQSAFLEALGLIALKRDECLIMMLRGRVHLLAMLKVKLPAFLNKFPFVSQFIAEIKIIGHDKLSMDHYCLTTKKSPLMNDVQWLMLKLCQPLY